MKNKSFANIETQNPANQLVHPLRNSAQTTAIGRRCLAAMALLACGLAGLANTRAESPVRPQPPTALAWEAESKTVETRPGDQTAEFTFFVTNVSSEAVIITNLQRSCGCTSATMPAQPWTLVPGTNGPIHASIDLRGKSGQIMKALTVQSSAGAKVLMLNVHIAPRAPASTATPDRARNQQTAAVDRQAVFQGECASCHAQTTVGKLGQELYQAGCGICHDAENRAPMVADLRVKHPADGAEWRQWIADSKPGSLMPAFSRIHGGPLTEEQIASLVDYLVRRYGAVSTTAG